ncbi:hypothetical protein M409DRAFT_69061 [Zasmidium cellare ATCC 36951]|uniref:NmrA-like domain-containing protein n=1 Tax=Zasmidium cellare ATCC 36951 TaxID=1080233 RepID=A0A6A6C5X2_ZASCE|nr:uncharacterized protein M409DRAFT_69061 [Zasmidium cellare ATCC 36951]KAF2162451.1 hypothetical protein M409DRAFT_69061 [Zasmidium cellare ATCC 36951]
MATAPTAIAIFGATGNLGSSIVNALLATGRHNVTSIGRLESKTSLPEAVRVVKGDLNSPTFLKQALQGHDAVIIALGLDTPQALDKAIVTAAAEADIKYIFPNEFVSQDSLRKHFPFGLHEKKNEIRTLIEKLGKSRWIAIVNGTCYDFSLLAGSYNIDVGKRRATIWTPSTAAANFTTVAKVGKAIAALLSLEEDQLKQYVNRCVYISSFKVSQLDILKSVQHATQTQPTDWQITHENVDEAVRDGQESAKQGKVEGLIKVIYAMQFLSGAGGDYEAMHGTSDVELGLEREDLDMVTRDAVAKSFYGSVTENGDWAEE